MKQELRRIALPEPPQVVLENSLGVEVVLEHILNVQVFLEAN